MGKPKHLMIFRFSAMRDVAMLVPVLPEAKSRVSSSELCSESSGPPKMSPRSSSPSSWAIPSLLSVVVSAKAGPQKSAASRTSVVRSVCMIPSSPT